MTCSPESSRVPVLGILGWDAGNADTLTQLEALPGNIAHPDTFGFPVRYLRVQGACFETVVVRPSPAVRDIMIAAAQELESEGVQVIATNCGFNALFQRELADSVAVPVFASSLLQVPMVHRMLKKNQSVGIITADSSLLSRAHLESVGITREVPYTIAGIQETGEFSRIRSDPRAVLDGERMKEEIVDVAVTLIRAHPETGAIVLECTDLPPFSAAIRQMTGLPVFDIVTMACWVVDSAVGDRWMKSSCQLPPAAVKGEL
jgi:Asp/Glu/hydantoin racemase